MKPFCFLLAAPLLLLLGGCLEPIPFDTPGYPRNNSNLRYPPSTTNQGSSRANPGGNQYNRYPSDNWNRPSQPSQRPRYNDPAPTPEPKPRPKPKPRPRPKPPEEKPLVDLDPIEEANREKYPYAIPVQGATNLVVSPYAKEGPYIDISGLSSGTQIECNKTGKTILVP